MTDSLAIITIMLIPLVPLFWIPVHGLSKLFKRLGIFTYITPMITWLPIAWLIYVNRTGILRYKLDLPAMVEVMGWLVFLVGMLLQLWTIKLLGGGRIMGLPEVTDIMESKIIMTGPFTVIRHPTYLSHSIMFIGVFFISGVIALGIITLIDAIIVNLFVIPLEDRELIERFGDDYRRYKNRVPAFFPEISKK